MQDLCSGEDFFLKGVILYCQQGSDTQPLVTRAARETVLTLSILRLAVLGSIELVLALKSTSTKIPSRAPLQPLKVTGTTSEQLGMDIVGPVERSKAGNCYMLVITDYTTKYPDVFPLKSTKAKSVAFCLVHLSRVGFPREILTHRGTNVMFTLLKQVYQFLGIII